jgi:RNA polymerase sigma-70 factor (family 1)
LNRLDKLHAKALKKGEVSALEKAYAEHSVRVFNLAYRITSSKEDAEEVVQDTFLKLWRLRTNIDTNQPLGGYIYTIARNLSIDKLTAASKRLRHLQKADLGKVCESNDNNFFLEEAERVVEDTIEALPKKRKEVFRMKVNSGLTNKQIALQLSISETMVEKQIRLASGLLREKLSSTE